MRDDYLIFGDIDTRTYHVGIYGDQLASAPERDQEFVEVPGHNGDMILDNGRYKNIVVSYKAYIIKDYDVNIKGFRNALLAPSGYTRLQDTIHPDEFRLAKALPWEVDEYGILKAGEFTMQFNCKPQRFLIEGEYPIDVTANTTILSSSNQIAKPLIRAYGTGTFSINGISVQVTSASGYTDIDCDLQECYKDTLATNCNGNVILAQGRFPELAPGENAIVMSGFSKLEIIPRWWIL